MEYTGLESIKKSYRDFLQEHGNYKEAARLQMSDITDPVFSGLSLHGEEEMNVASFNKALQDIGIDLIALNSQFSSAAILYKDLMDDMLSDLENVDSIIKKEKDRIQDLNIILGNVSGFSSVITYEVSDLIGEASGIDEYTFGASVTTRNAVTVKITDVSGNGYEGNKYVYNGDGVFLEEVFDTSDRNKMIDNSDLTYYEYSRLTAPEKPRYYPVDLNIDNVDASCTISIAGKAVFNTVIISSDFKDLEITQVAVSSNGKEYTNTISESIRINKNELKYEDSNYVYGAGVLSFSNTYYLKLTFKSNGILRDQVGFKRVILDGIYVDRNYAFPITKFIQEYLAPLTAIVRKTTTGKINAYRYIWNSVVLALILATTRTRAAMIGSSNFLRLNYDSELTELPADLGMCAFETGKEGMSAAYEYIYRLSDTNLTSAFTVNATDNNKRTAIRTISQIMNGSDTNLSDLALDYYDNYDLSQYDTLAAYVMEDETINKYEQYFKRYDTQKSLGRTIDSAENIVLLYNASRRAIRINEISCFSSKYNDESMVETGEIILSPVDCIAAFSSEYIPSTFPKGDWIKYIFVINGTEIEVVPINSNKSGIKIIRFSDYSAREDYTQHITEPIKSANLKIIIKTKNNQQSPFVSNVKVCLGKPVITGV